VGLDEEKVPWQRMSVLRLLATLGCVAGVIAILVYIASSRANGLGMLAMAAVIAWLCFAVVMSMGAMASVAVWTVSELLMLFVQNEDTKERVWLGIRWVVFVAGLGTLLWMGGRGVYDGMLNNRLASPKELYDQCMLPQTRTVEHSWQECSDGWGSDSIGRRGACSWHGGVVWRSIQRKERYQPHDAKYCREDAAARSWVD
jgi:hypothetical protein